MAAVVLTRADMRVAQSSATKPTTALTNAFHAAGGTMLRLSSARHHRMDQKPTLGLGQKHVARVASLRLALNDLDLATLDLQYPAGNKYATLKIPLMLGGEPVEECFDKEELLEMAESYGYLDEASCSGTGTAEEASRTSRRLAADSDDSMTPAGDATTSGSPRVPAGDASSFGAFGFSPGGSKMIGGFSEKTVLLEEAKNPWTGPKQLVNTVCIIGGGTSAYIATTGLLAKSMGVNAASVAGQTNTEIALNICVDLGAFVYGLVSWRRERADREKRLSQISEDEDGTLARLKTKDKMREGSLFDKE